MKAVCAAWRTKGTGLPRTPSPVRVGAHRHVQTHLCAQGPALWGYISAILHTARSAQLSNEGPQHSECTSTRTGDAAVRGRRSDKCAVCRARQVRWSVPLLKRRPVFADRGRSRREVVGTAGPHYNGNNGDKAGPTHVLVCCRWMEEWGRQLTRRCGVEGLGRGW